MPLPLANSLQPLNEGGLSVIPPTDHVQDKPFSQRLSPSPSLICRARPENQERKDVEILLFPRQRRFKMLARYRSLMHFHTLFDDEPNAGSP
jgi:hypothetical protein